MGWKYGTWGTRAGEIGNGSNAAVRSTTNVGVEGRGWNGREQGMEGNGVAWPANIVRQNRTVGHGVSPGSGDRSYSSAVGHGDVYRGGILISCIALVLKSLTLASTQCWDGTRRVFTDQADIASCTKLEAPP